MATKRIIVKVPLSPEMMEDIGAFKGFPPTQEDFQPDGNWTGTYRIWTCHGYRKSNKKNLGVLKLSQEKAREKDAVNLQITQHIVTDKAIIHITEASVLCALDDIWSVKRWRLRSKFVDPAKQENESVAANEKSEIDTDKNILTIDTGGRKYKRKSNFTWNEYYFWQSRLYLWRQTD
ncbi:MAG: hypothetical protein KAS75_04580 [Planctomycetes bacterium]|nr:hypothetical protein [Planctomycetota bacterium]